MEKILLYDGLLKIYSIEEKRVKLSEKSIELRKFHDWTKSENVKWEQSQQ